MDKGRLQIFQILDFLEKPKSVFLGRRGKSPPRSKDKSLQKCHCKQRHFFRFVAFSATPSSGEHPTTPPRCLQRKLGSDLSRSRFSGGFKNSIFHNFVFNFSARLVHRNKRELFFENV